MTLEASEAQAESELEVALGIGGTGFTPPITGIALDELGPSSTANAYLFAVSAVLVQTAIEQAGEAGSVDGTLQELLDTIASDVAAGGPLPPGLTAELRQVEQDLDVDLTMDLFYDRLQAIGSTASAADLNLAVDSDGDGVRNSVDTCPLVANPNQGKIPSGVRVPGHAAHAVLEHYMLRDRMPARVGARWRLRKHGTCRPSGLWDRRRGTRCRALRWRRDRPPGRSGCRQLRDVLWSADRGGGRRPRRQHRPCRRRWVVGRQWRRIVCCGRGVRSRELRQCGSYRPRQGRHPRRRRRVWPAPRLPCSWRVLQASSARPARSRFQARSPRTRKPSCPET